MKRILAIIVITMALTGCSAQKRAERHVRKAVELCPELVQKKAHVVDTFLTVGPWVDFALVPFGAVLRLDTIYAATDHGTVIVNFNDADSSLRVGFVAAPQNVHYKDTLTYAQVVVPDPQPTASGNGFWSRFALLVGLGIGVTLGFYVICKILTQKRLQ